MNKEEYYKELMKSKVSFIEKKKNKYNAIKTIVDGITFDSIGESRRYMFLKNSEKLGFIKNLELQPKYVFVINYKPILIKSERYPKGRRCSYTADFRYTENGNVIVEDFKGKYLPISKIKIALMDAIFGIKVKIISGEKNVL